MKKILLIILTALLISCTNSSSKNKDNNNDNSDGLSQNACSSIGLSTRIINGTACREENSPVVQLIIALPGGVVGTCTGNMLTSTTLITAAHCFFDNPIYVAVRAGDISTNVTSIISHPRVSVDSSGFVYNDAAIVKLASPLDVQTLPIVISRTPAKGEELKIFGYGITEDQNIANDTTGTLRSGEMLVSGVDSNFISAGFNGKDGSNTCSGDSGGPALYEFEGGIGLVGVLSTGEILECTAGDTSRFTNLQTQSVLSFIVENVPGAAFI